MTRATDDAQRLAELERLNQVFVQFVPHNRALGLHFVHHGSGRALLALPYDDKLVGNPETGVLHGGAISSLLDAACGASVFMRLEVPSSVATLDLRIDYLRPATPRLDVICRAECFKVTSHVAFVRALAFHEESDPIASAAGSFMIFQRGTRSGTRSE